MIKDLCCTRANDGYLNLQNQEYCKKALGGTTDTKCFLFL